MEVVEETVGEVLVIRPVGRLDGSSSPDFEKRLLGHIEGGRHRLVLDLAQLDYVSSAGLRVMLLAAKKTAAAKGSVALCGLKDRIREVLEISGFTSLFKIHPDAAAALKPPS